MNLIVAGGREFADYRPLKRTLDHLLSNTNKEDITILSGMARGADLLGKRYAEESGITIQEFPADWSKGKQAGYLRNAQMAEEATHLVAYWDGKSKGTKHMLDIAHKKGLIIRVVNYE